MVPRVWGTQVIEMVRRGHSVSVAECNLIPGEPRRLRLPQYIRLILLARLSDLGVTAAPSPVPLPRLPPLLCGRQTDRLYSTRFACMHRPDDERAPSSYQSRRYNSALISFFQPKTKLLIR